MQPIAVTKILCDNQKESWKQQLRNNKVNRIFFQNLKERSSSFLVKALSWTSRNIFSFTLLFLCTCEEAVRAHQISIHCRHLLEILRFDACLHQLSRFISHVLSRFYLPVNFFDFSIFLPGIVFSSRCSCWCTCQIFTFFF